MRDGFHKQICLSSTRYFLVSQLDDYAGCSYCPGGVFCLASDFEESVNATRTDIEHRRVLTTFDIIWPFIIVSFFVVNELGRLITVIENFRCCLRKKTSHKPQAAKVETKVWNCLSSN